MNQQANEKTTNIQKTCCLSCCVVTGIVLLFALVCLLSIYYRYNHVEIGENKETSPMFYTEKGKNYSYAICYPLSYFEFTISESDFLDWCEEQSWEPVEIKSLPSYEIPVSIARYCCFKKEHKECYAWTGKCQIDPSGKTDKACFCTSDDGYFCHLNKPERNIMYDRKKQRCYILWHRRSG